MFSKIFSLFKLLSINIQRVIDHLIRYFSGLPTMKRSKITTEVYLGGQYNTSGLRKLKKQGITGIINMRTHSFKPAAEKAGMKYLHLPTPDRHAPSLEHLKEGVKFIEKEIKNKGIVYVHCRWGEGQGPTMTIAYLMSTGLTLEDALNHVQKVRSFANPTAVQREQLQKIC